MTGDTIQPESVNVLSARLFAGSVEGLATINGCLSQLKDLTDQPITINIGLSKYRKFVLIEQDDNYYNLANKRIEKHLSELK